MEEIIIPEQNTKKDKEKYIRLDSIKKRDESTQGKLLIILIDCRSDLIRSDQNIFKSRER